MMAPLYLSPRIPQPYFYDGEGMKPLTSTEPPPAHRAHTVSIPPATVYSAQPTVLPPPSSLAHLQHREKEEIGTHQTKDADGNVRYQIVYSAPQGPPAQSLVAPATNPRPIQLTTPPIASQVPLHADTLSRLLERYPLMWQGLLALKTEQAAVQMHFVFGNKKIAKASLPFNSDHTTPPLRIAQRMRLEQSQIEGVARKMQVCWGTIKEVPGSSSNFSSLFRSPTNIAFFWRCPAASTTATFSDKPKTSKSASSTTSNRSKLPASSTSPIPEAKMLHTSFTSSHHVSSPTKAWRESHRI